MSCGANLCHSAATAVSNNNNLYLKKKKASNCNKNLTLKFWIFNKMANTLSVMANALRNKVSKKRNRYIEDGFNLDLTYINKNIIAMGYPADKIEGIYRNRIDHVYEFFDKNHRDHYKIYNLCSEKNYDITKFHNRVAAYPFADHNPPTIELIQKFCDDVDGWLKEHSNNVAAIHCKAGKGRTGTMICCYLLYCGFKTTSRDSLAYYDEKRTKDRRGVTIPSQRRYVDYFSKIIRSSLHYERRTLQICEISFSSMPLMYSQGSVQCSISTLQYPSSEKVQLLHTFAIDFRHTLSIEIKDMCLPLTGDIRIEVSQDEVFQKRKKYFHFWFNTFFVYDTAEKDEDIRLILDKQELDDAHKDRDHKSFADDFKVSILLKPIPSNRPFVCRNEIPQNINFQINNASGLTNNVGHHHHAQQLNNHLTNSQVNESSSPPHATTTTTTISDRNSKFVENNCRKSKPPQHHQHQQSSLPPVSQVSAKSQHPILQQQQPHRIYSNETHQHLVNNTNSAIKHKQQLQRQTPSVSPDITRTNSKNSNTSTISTNSSSSSISSSSTNSHSSSAVGEDWESENLRNENSQSEEGKDASPRVSLNKNILITNNHHHSSIDEEDNDGYNLIPTTSSTCTTTTATTTTTMSSSLSRRHSNLPLSIGVKSMLSKNFKTRPRREST